MALCDQGYLCEVCGKEVERLRDSDLYLRYVLGLVPAERLHQEPERHLRCNPTLAQFIVHEKFQPPCFADGDFDKRILDREFVTEREQRVTAGYVRLLELQRNRRDLDITRYPINHSAE